MIRICIGHLSWLTTKERPGTVLTNAVGTKYIWSFNLYINITFLKISSSVTFQVLHSHIWLLATILDSTDMDITISIDFFFLAMLCSWWNLNSHQGWNLDLSNESTES